MKHILGLLVIIVCFFSQSFAQKTNRYYYYHGNKVNLQPDTWSFGVLTGDTLRVKEEITARGFSLSKPFVSVLDKRGCSYYTIISSDSNNHEYTIDSLCLMLSLIPQTTTTQCFKKGNRRTGVSNRFYVQLRNLDDSLLLYDFATTQHVNVLYDIPNMPDWFVLSCPYNCSKDAIDCANHFFESGFFYSAEPEFEFEGRFASDDTYYSDQWGLRNDGQYFNEYANIDIKATAAWKISKGMNTLVAIYDSGVYPHHPDLNDNIINNSFDAQTGSSSSYVYDKHGTACAGIVAAEENGVGIAGVAPKSGITSISIALNPLNTPEQFASGFNWARENNIDVINNSWGGIDTSSLIETAINRLINEGRGGKGCVVVFSSGNENDTNIEYPGNFSPDILVVGAMSPCGERKSPSSCDHEFWGSCYGEQLDIMAPGVLIPTTDYPGNAGFNPNIPIHHNMGGDLVENDYDDVDYTVWFNGTSSACPHVVGVAALMLSINPNLTSQEVCNIIEQTAQKVRKDLYNYIDTFNHVNGTWCSQMGYGLIDAHRAVLKAAYHKIYGDSTLTLCDINHAYTVRSPHNANIDSVSFFWTCSNNLQILSGQNTDSVWVRAFNGGIGQLCCHIVHDSDTVVSKLVVPIVSNQAVYDNISLDNGMNYPDTLILSRNIEIDSMTVLTWQNKRVLCTPDCRIIVRPGGKFMMDGCILTSACSNEMWQGVEVVGDRSKHQTEADQGTVVFKNGALVENARCGIRTGLGNDNWNTTGGIVTVQNSIFHNCAKAVEFLAYTDTLATGFVNNNLGSFKNCTFTVDTTNLFAINGISFLDHISLCAVKGVKFIGCTFQNLTNGLDNRRHAIFAHNAGFLVDERCDGYDPLQNPPVLPDYCGCQPELSDSCFFEGFETAIEASTDGMPFSVTINRARFASNATAVRINANNFATVTECDFDLQSVPIGLLENIGLYLDNCTGYLVEGNSFTKSNHAQLTNISSTGICVKNSDTLQNEIHRNFFYNLNYGIYVKNINGNNKKGLQLTCNSFDWNDYDIYMSLKSSLKANQGSLYEGADNTFTNTRISSIHNDGAQQLTYYFSRSSSHTPYNVTTTNVTLNFSAAANACASTLCSGEVPQPPVPLSVFSSMMSAYTTVASEMEPSTTTGGHSMCSQTNTNGFPPSVCDMPQQLACVYYNAVRALMADSLLDMDILEQWHVAAQPIADPYSLTETRFVLGYDEDFVHNNPAIPLSQAAEFPIATDDYYTEFHNLKRELRGFDRQINWYTLTPVQILELQNIADAGTGRSSVMARGVLCFFFNICDEELTPLGDTRAMQANGALHANLDGFDNADYPEKPFGMVIYPNPANDVLHISIEGIDNPCGTLTVSDLTGVVVLTRECSANTLQLNVSALSCGLYVITFRNKNGVIVRKFVKL
ncbi:MAG: S8 family peptidase [Bacteroidales bacterium]|nr:S8 family peptidase [Bacteroidales bacterium]